MGRNFVLIYVIHKITVYIQTLKKSNQVANAYFGSFCSKINFVIAVELSPETLCDFVAVVSYWCLIDLTCKFAIQTI